MGDIFEFLLLLLPLLLLLVDVAGHGPPQLGLNRVWPPADAHQHLGLLPQVFVDPKNQDGHQGKVDEPQPDKYGVPGSKPCLPDLSFKQSL